MRIVVTGASGFIGRPLVARLVSEGHAVRAWSRDVARATRALPARCQVEAWEPAARLDPQRLRDVDAIVHLAGEGVAQRRWTPARKAAIRDSRVVGTRALITALAELAASARPRILIGASAIGLYGDRGDVVLDEDAAPGSGFLAAVCREWEAETQRAESLGLRVARLRIGIVLGAHGGALRAMLPAFRLGLGGRLGSGRQWMSWIHIDDVVELLRFALLRDDVSGALNAVAPAPLTNADFTRALGLTLHRPTLLRAPAAALRLAAGELAGVVLASQRVQPAAALRRGFVFRYPDATAALAECCRDLSRLIDVEQWLPQPPDAVFPFYADAANLERITPPFLGFRVLRSSTPRIGEGTRIDYRLRLHGLPVSWRSVIEQWQPCRHFVDRQERGPYALWHHTHSFAAHAGGTLVRDRVRYRLPFGALGELLAGGLVGRDLARIFAFRHDATATIFAAPPPADGVPA